MLHINILYIYILISLFHKGNIIAIKVIDLTAYIEYDNHFEPSPKTIT